MAALQSTRGESLDRSKATRDAVAAALNAAAERIESITKKLNQTTGGSGSVALG